MLIRFVTPAALALLVIAPLCAMGQTGREGAYDTPILSPVDNGLYSVTLKVQAGPSGAPGGFTVQWMKRSDFVAAGGWPESPTDPRIGNGNFVGSPTLNLWGASSFKLAPGEAAYVQPGDLFDETGLATNTTAATLQPGTDYVTRVRALPATDGTASDFTGAVETRTLNGECTLGFWKNFPDRWPSTCLPLLLGTVSYTKSQLLQIFDQPAKGNGLISLAHQLIAARLNLCNGSDPTAVTGTIASADAQIGGLVVPPIGSGTIAPEPTSSLTEALDDYNNGRLGGVSECPTMTRTVGTWGMIKVLYR
jgi:hypothetical protein